MDQGVYAVLGGTWSRALAKKMPHQEILYVGAFPSRKSH